MSRAALRALDAAMVAAFDSAGLADAATHRSRVDGTETPCTVLRDDDYIVTSEGLVQLGAGETSLVIQRAEVEAQAGDSVTLTETGEVFRLVAVVTRDQSMVTWRAVPARAEEQP